MLIDTHAHLNFNAYKDDVGKVIQRSLENNVWIINVGSQYFTSKRAVEIAQNYEKGVYAAVGLHPIHLETGLVKIKNDREEIEIKTKEEDFDYEKYKEMAKSEKVVALGEFGLDYYWKPKTTKKKELFKQKQKNLALKQLELAKELNLPVIFHCRLAHDDLIEILQKYGSWKIKGVVHGFVGTTGQLEKYLKMGLYLGFNGIIFKNIQGIDFQRNIKKTPLSKILIETDCPYLIPPLEVLREGDRKNSPRNEPCFVKYVAEKIAQIKKTNYEQTIKTTTENAKNLFRLK